ncbi:hypothetical protein pp309_000020 [Proteus phage 309]|uniref:Uncharacterized protein n=1 Tax=Proteus phage 309 TaxID=2894355 RepID=A0AAE8YIV6_9CAUD|nr:hypothetical protein pp309_000020 [Proteus phage 309]
MYVLLSVLSGFIVVITIAIILQPNIEVPNE